ncbi:MAG: DEAD/DEAH box helicase [Deltaproteobacteria bacterium]|nr:DEAD/DEAH box helicase [Deltaproteobacteria bacterium]
MPSPSRVSRCPRSRHGGQPPTADGCAPRPTRSGRPVVPSPPVSAPTHALEFDPLVAGWFAERFRAPTPPQTEGWRAIAAGRDVLIAAPTGSGKTLAAFLWAIDRLVRTARSGGLVDETTVVYVSPLKALGNDIRKNLEQPLAEIRARAFATGVHLPEVRVAVRTGDTPRSERQAMVRKPPHVLITTPESLYILLTADKSRAALASARTVIVDEIHAVAGDKRGAHLALTLERLDALAGRKVQRIGLSATQHPIERVAELLVGGGRRTAAGTADCAIVDTGHRRAMDLAVETTDHEIGAIASYELWASIYDRIVGYVATHRTTIVFVNTRRLVERVAHQLSERLGDDRVVAHHGSLSRTIRLDAEQKLKSGAVPVVVATASLELGIDVGHVDLVCHIGSPRALATLLQRVGRSGHWLGSVPKGIFFPLTRDDLLQTAAAVRAIRASVLDRLRLSERPLDILAQQIVAIAAADEIGEDDLFALVRRARPYRDLERRAFDEVLEMLAEGVATRRGRRSAHLHRDLVHRRVRGRRGARLAAITGGGAIPDTADYDVVEEPGEARVGKVNEDFAIESMRGDIFLLGNHSWRIRRVENGTVRVEDAGQAPPTIPFWTGEAPARTRELSAAVSELRAELAARIPDRAAPPPQAVVEWLVAECGIDAAGALQLAAYVRDTLAVLGTVPTCDTVVAERFFDESGGMQLVIHAPFGGAINRAWGLALRKRFCVSFDFELQAAATDDGIVLSLGEQHSFPLANVFAMARLATLEHDLVQATLQAPMFGTRWRWNATRALALLRHSGGRRVPMNIQRMRADDLLAAVFPMQAACGDNHAGPIEPPKHPLVDETIANCLYEAMDTDGLREVLERIARGEIRTVAVETPAPSVMAHEILNANPYAFLDDAPLEERRARAVALRRADPAIAAGIGALDAEAIAAVRGQAWPDARHADELHDALLTLVWLPADALGPWAPWADELVLRERAAWAAWEYAGTPRRALVAAERLALARALVPTLTLAPALVAPALAPQACDGEAAAVALVRGWLECLGPTTIDDLAARLGVAPTVIGAAMARLEGEGVALQGRFTPGAPGDEWCERRLLARIHHLTLGRLRREIDPVSAADFMRFLFRWQHVLPETRLHGRDGLVAVIAQLHGIELPAPAWERTVLPARVAAYEPGLLDDLCLSGIAAWGRFSAPGDGDTTSDPAVEHAAVGARRRVATRRAGTPAPEPAQRRRLAPTRAAPLALALRADLDTLRTARPDPDSPRLSPAARDVAAFLAAEGASFTADIAAATGLLPSTTEEALWELVVRGIVSGDGFAGLRRLIAPEERPRPERRLRALHGGRAARRPLPAGRWALLAGKRDALPAAARVEAAARQFLARYGVVLRELLAREALMPPWRELLAVLRRLEARGEIRGGRFVAGFVGEQFALPDAVEALRDTRRRIGDAEILLVAAADPLNLVGIVTPGARISPLSGQVIAWERGVPIDSGDLGAVRHRLRDRGLAASGA